MIRIKIDEIVDIYLEVGDTLKIRGPKPELIGDWELVRHTTTKAFFEDATRTMVVIESGVLIEPKGGSNDS